MDSLVSLCPASVLGFHIAFYIQTYNFLFRIGTDGDGFTEVSGEFARTVVRNLDNSCLARLDRLLGILGNRASAGSNSLMDDEDAVARILEFEFSAYLRLFFRKLSEIVRSLFERNLGSSLSHTQHNAEQK